jgi:hypothetical protein
MRLKIAVSVVRSRPWAPFKTHLRTILADAARSSTFLPFLTDLMAVDLGRVDEISLKCFPDWNWSRDQGFQHSWPEASPKKRLSLHRNHANACSPSHARSIILRKTQPPVGFVIVVPWRKIWQISENLFDDNDNEATSVNGFRVPQHHKPVVVQNLLR